jgi:hypothetical protein
MKKMFNFSVLLSLCFSIINTECSVSSDIRKLAVSLIDSPPKQAACILIPLNMLSIYSAFKEYKNYKNNNFIANAIKEDPVYNFNSIVAFCASQRKSEFVCDVNGKLSLESVYDSALMDELNAIEDISNDNPVFTDFASKVADMIKPKSAINRNCKMFFAYCFAHLSCIAISDISRYS